MTLSNNLLYLQKKLISLIANKPQYSE